MELCCGLLKGLCWPMKVLPLTCKERALLVYFNLSFYSRYQWMSLLIRSNSSFSFFILYSYYETLLRNASLSALNFLLTVQSNSYLCCRSFELGLGGCLDCGCGPLPLALRLRQSTSLASLITKMPFLSLILSQYSWACCDLEASSTCSRSISASFDFIIACRRATSQRADSIFCQIWDRSLFTDLATSSVCLDLSYSTLQRSSNLLHFSSKTLVFSSEIFNLSCSSCEILLIRSCQACNLFLAASRTLFYQRICLMVAQQLPMIRIFSSPQLLLGRLQCYNCTTSCSYYLVITPSLLYNFWLPQRSNFISSAIVRICSLVSACYRRQSAWILSRKRSASLVFSCS